MYIHRQTHPYSDFLAFVSKQASQWQSTRASLDVLAEEVGMRTMELAPGSYLLCEPDVSVNSDWGVIFSGYSIIGAKLIRGTAQYLQYSGSCRLCDQTGDFTALRWSSSGLTACTDLLGMGILYYFAGQDFALVTNRPHLGALALNRILGPQLRINIRLLRTLAIPGRLTLQQPFNQETPIEGFFRAGIGEEISLSHFGSVTFRKSNALVQVNEEGADYSELIQHAAREAVQNVTAVLESGDFEQYICDLSGGKDSRMVFGALIASSTTHAKKVRLHTKNSATAEAECSDDLAVATRLAARFDMAFEDSFEGCLDRISADEAFSIWRSYFLGSYHRVGLPSFTKRGTTKTVHFSGGCGEALTCTAEVGWARESFEPGDTLADAVCRWVRNTFVQARKEIGDVEFSELLDYINKSLCRYSHANPHDAINAFYLETRNRVHFGMIHYPYFHDYLSTFPLTSKSLFAAARMLSENERREGRLIFDLLQELDPRLLEEPFASRFLYAERRLEVRTIAPNMEKLEEWRRARAEMLRLRGSAIRKTSVGLKKGQLDFSRRVHVMSAVALLEMRDRFEKDISSTVFDYSLKALDVQFSLGQSQGFAYASYILGMRDYLWPDRLGQLTVADDDTERHAQALECISSLHSATMTQSGSHIDVDIKLYGDIPQEKHRYALQLFSSVGEVIKLGFQTTPRFRVHTPLPISHAVLYCQTQHHTTPYRLKPSA